MSAVSPETNRNGFPESMVFQNTWRSYQARVLEHLDSYLDDKRVHIVAAPGSGKTVLGLEIIRRIDQPTLVLAPTITIRDQWVDRLVGLFLPAGRSRPSWISTDLRKPAPLTIVTYQALHCLCSGEINKDLENINEKENHNHSQEHSGGDPNDQVGPVVQFPEVLAQAGFRTLAVDEAHHLRAEWWRTLKFVAEHLNKPTIVALTATPPYDVSSFAWQRYEELCGAVDAEVSVPELVLSGDLCPHQDYVYFSVPSEREQRVLSEFRAAVDSFIQRLRSDKGYTAALVTHPWLRDGPLLELELLRAMTFSQGFNESHGHVVEAKKLSENFPTIAKYCDAHELQTITKSDPGTLPTRKFAVNVFSKRLQIKAETVDRYFREASSMKAKQQEK